MHWIGSERTGIKGGRNRESDGKLDVGRQNERDDALPQEERRKGREKNSKLGIEKTIRS